MSAPDEYDQQSVTGSATASRNPLLLSEDDEGTREDRCVAPSHACSTAPALPDASVQEDNCNGGVTFSEQHNLSQLGFTEGELEELDRLMSIAAPPDDTLTDVHDAPPAPGETEESEVDRLNRIIAQHRPPFVPYAPELEEYAGDEREEQEILWRVAKRERATTPGAIRVMWDEEKEEEQAVEMDGPRPGGRWHCCGEATYAENLVGRSNDNESSNRAVAALATASSNGAEEAIPTGQPAASGSVASISSNEDASSASPTAAEEDDVLSTSPATSGEEEALPSSTNEEPPDLGEAADIENQRGASAVEGNDDTSWNPELPIAAAVVDSPDESTEHGYDGFHENSLTENVTTMVKAERVGWRTYLQDKPIRLSAIAMSILVMGLTLGLAIALTSRGGDDSNSTSSEKNKNVEDLEAGRGPDDGNNNDISSGNGTCSKGYIPTCGDCWCALDSGTSTECPPYPEGWLNSCMSRSHELANVYKDFQLASMPDYLHNLPRWESQNGDSKKSNEPPRLVTSEGEPCNPFSFRSSPSSSNPWEGLPACYAQNLNEGIVTAVCGFTFPGGVVKSMNECSKRTYDMVNYRDYASAVLAGAKITHLGSCGVCSTAQDFAALLANDNFYEQISLCNALPANKARDGKPDYHRVHACYIERLGISHHCAMIYSIWSLGRQTFCFDECAPSRVYFSSEDPKFWRGGEPPKCDSVQCEQCSWLNEGFGLAQIVGRADITSSITADGRYSCSSVAPLPLISHDLCDGLL